MKEQGFALMQIIKSIAEQKEITNYKLSFATGIGLTSLARYFSNENLPSLETFLKLCKVLDINIFLEDTSSDSEINVDFEKAMEQVGRRPGKLPKN